MKTELKRTEDLKPGDKLYLPWPADAHKPEWHRAPEVVTVKYFDGNDIILEEMGGICLRPVKDHEFKVVISEVPESGDHITFRMDWFNDLGLTENREFTEVVESISEDPLKRHKPKCIVTINHEQYGITFDMISKIQKQIIAKPQLELF